MTSIIFPTPPQAYSQQYMTQVLSQIQRNAAVVTPGEPVDTPIRGDASGFGNATAAATSTSTAGSAGTATGTGTATASTSGTTSPVFGEVYFENFGAVGNGVADDYAACQAALNSGYKLIKGKAGATYLVNTTLIVPSGVTLDLQGFLPGNPALGTQIIGGAAVSPVLQVGVGTTNGVTMVKNGTIGRVTGTPNAARIGIRVFDGYNVQFENVHSDNHGINWQFSAHPTTGSGLGVNLHNCHASRSVDTYVDIDSWPELYWHGGRFGMNGSGDYNGTSFVRFRGGVTLTAGGPNTIKFTACQFNQGSNAPNYFLEFVSLAASYPGVAANIFNFAQCHFEGIDTAAIFSDSSWNIIDNLTFSQCFFNHPGEPFLALNAGTQIFNWDFIGNEIACSTFNISSTAQINGLRILGGWISGTMAIAPGGIGSTVAFMGTQHSGNVVFTGTYGKLTVHGSMHYAGALDISAALGVVVVQSEGTWTPALKFGGAATGMTGTFAGNWQMFGRVVTGNFRIVLTAKGSSTGASSITGWPFNHITDATGSSCGGIVNWYINMAALNGHPSIGADSGTSTLYLWDALATTVAQLTDAHFTNTSEIRGNFSFFIR